MDDDFVEEVAGYAAPKVEGPDMAKELEIVVPAVKPSVKADNDKNVKYELVEGDTALIRVNGTDLIDTVIPELTDGVKAVELHIVVNWKLLR